MSDFSNLTSFLWWLMLLSSTVIILYDIVAAARGPALSLRAQRKPDKREDEDEFDVIARQVSRALQRPSSLQVLETNAAETILIAACAAQGIEKPKGNRINPRQIETLFKDDEIVTFLKEQLASDSTRPELKRGQMLAELQRMAAVLDKAGFELT